ncbi:adenylate kinase [Dactylosporangium sp. NPDC000555]|uniref:adenylate kinase n=1 Tax=Dactylosporangium sp. NPDC000555 TaxID=3154260 RepID=UPI0033269141
MKLLMIAPPGAGKGTQGRLIADHFRIPLIAAGELLREHVARGTELGRAVRGYLDQGELVPDEIVLNMVREALISAEATGGEYVLDGVPRTIEQARAIYTIGVQLGMIPNVALHLQANDEELVRRLLTRASDERRPDDTEEVIRRRLDLYHSVTEPIVAWYGRRGILVCVDAMGPVEQVGRDILAALEAMQPTVEYVPEQLRRTVDLTGLDTAFGHSATNRRGQADR